MPVACMLQVCTPAYALTARALTWLLLSPCQMRLWQPHSHRKAALLALPV